MACTLIVSILYLSCQTPRYGPCSAEARTRWRLLGDVVELVGVGTGAARFAAVQAGDGVHFVAGEVEVEDVEVRLHPLAVHRLREHDVAALDVPAQHHLGRIFAVPIGDAGYRWVVEHLALRDWRPGLRRDLVLVAVGAHLLVAEVRVYLDLIDGGHG